MATIENNLTTPTPITITTPNDPLVDKINDWKKYPNALGSEAQAAVIIGEISSKLGEDVPDEVMRSLKSFSVRSLIRELDRIFSQPTIFNEISDNKNIRLNVNIDINNLLDSSLSQQELSSGEALTIITRYFERYLNR